MSEDLQDAINRYKAACKAVDSILAQRYLPDAVSWGDEDYEAFHRAKQERGECGDMVLFLLREEARSESREERS